MTFSRRQRHVGQFGAGGQALVEFSLLIFIFIVVLIAIFDLGRAVFAYNSITNGARESVRVAVVNQDESRIVERGLAQVALAETEDPNIEVEFWKATPNADPESNDPCMTIVRGCVAVVTFETTYRPITPLISSIIFGSGVTFTATSEQAVEFVCPNTTLTAAQCPKQP